MEIRMLESSKDKLQLKFMLSQSTPSYANTIRRLVVNRVPTLAIDDVEIRKNNSSLYDEMLAHRLGLIPLRTDLKSYNRKSQCKCNGEGCAMCEVKLTLKAKGPGIVYASELKSQDPKIVPVYEKMPIAQLQKGQEIELMATAVMGTGREHAKWAPGHIWFSYKPNITINNNSKRFDEFKDKYPPQIFSNGKIDKNLLASPELIDACDGVCEDIVKVEYDKESFVFYLESWGQLDAKEIIVTAIETLNNMVDEFSAQLEKQ